MSDSVKTQNLMDVATHDERVAAERTVLGGILLFPDELSSVVEVLRPDDFGADAHRRIFAAMIAVEERGDALDLISLGDQLRQAKSLEAVGGLAYLGSLDAEVPSLSSATRHAKIVRDTSTRRSIVAAAAKVAAAARDASKTADEALDTAQQAMLALVEQRSQGALVHIHESMVQVFRDVEKAFQYRQKHGDAPIGLSTGFADIDKVTSGLHPGELVIVAARPSMGKTALVMNIAAHVAIRESRPVAVFSMEMNRDSLLLRILASESRVSHSRLKNGDLGERDWPKMAAAADRIAPAPLFIDDSGGLTIFDVRSRCRRLKAQSGGLALIAIDYLQLMSGGGNGDNREQEISSISRGLKKLARELDCPVIALSQLNRSLEKRSDKRPMMSDLRESGAIEQDADTVAFIYRDEYYERESKDKGVAEIIIGKQRNGPTGTTRVRFDGDLVRFDDLEEHR